MTPEQFVTLTPAEFLAWLEAKGPAEIVGTAGDNATCPLATLARERGIAGALVGRRSLVIRARIVEDFLSTFYDADTFLLSKWQSDFVRAVDAICAPWDGEDPPEERRVTAEQAMAVLREVARGRGRL
jgi:hypothetical protein